MITNYIKVNMDKTMEKKTFFNVYMGNIMMDERYANKPNDGQTQCLT